MKEKEKELEEVFGKPNPTEEEMVDFIVTIKRRYADLAKKYNEAIEVLQSKRYDYFVKFLSNKDMFSKGFIKDIVNEIEESFGVAKEGKVRKE